MYDVQSHRTGSFKSRFPILKDYEALKNTDLRKFRVNCIAFQMTTTRINYKLLSFDDSVIN